ncbi:hypothetical protein [Jiangella asiatica]|uniref:DUF4352 domain-containing protein n=1 Tax=Jiangella asiatica TaxID=2530372 RepID=A0A4R5CRJ0_9ACTN|nr:hypothetical protein [Jiangella asiatica]TDE01044.1 hypothetical protein E1269_23970 [Jiangella asiatica]
MMAEAGGRLRRLARGAARRQPTVLSSVAGASVLAILVAGGFDPQEKTAELQPLVVDESVDLGPFDVTVRRLRVVDELPGVSESDDDTRVLALVATVSANGPKTQHGAMLTESVTLDGVTGVRADVFGEQPDDGEPVPAADAYVMADGSRLDAIQPGLEYEVAFVWEQDGAAEVPTTARLVLVGHTMRESSIDRSQEWLDPLPRVAGDLEVTEPEAETDAADDGDS